MATTMDRDACRDAYNSVRDDGSDVNWATFTYSGSQIVVDASGSSYDELVERCTEEARLFAYVRVVTGDAMSRRAKFVLVTWTGERVTGTQRAKVGPDRALLKEVVQTFAKEFNATEPHEVGEEFLRSELQKTGGANYDAQAP